MTQELYYNLTVLVSLFAIVVNFIIYKLNEGKNRVIYDLEKIFIDYSSKEPLKKVKEELNTGKYTLVDVSPAGRDADNQSFNFILGKVKK